MGQNIFVRNLTLQEKFNIRCSDVIQVSSGQPADYNYFMC